MASESATSPDQVERMQAFLTDHPGIRIGLPVSHDATWAAQRDGLVLCVEPELKTLLDHLEWILANEEKSLP